MFCDGTEGNFGVRLFIVSLSASFDRHKVDLTKRDLHEILPTNSRSQHKRTAVCVYVSITSLYQL